MEAQHLQRQHCVRISQAFAAYQVHCVSIVSLKNISSRTTFVVSIASQIQTIKQQCSEYSGMQLSSLILSNVQIAQHSQYCSAFTILFSLCSISVNSIFTSKGCKGYKSQTIFFPTSKDKSFYYFGSLKFTLCMIFSRFFSLPDGNIYSS